MSTRPPPGHPSAFPTYAPRRPTNPPQPPQRAQPPSTTNANSNTTSAPPSRLPSPSPSKTQATTSPSKPRLTPYVLYKSSHILAAARSPQPPIQPTTTDEPTARLRTLIEGLERSAAVVRPQLIESMLRAPFPDPPAGFVDPSTNPSRLGQASGDVEMGEDGGQHPRRANDDDDAIIAKLTIKTAAPNASPAIRPEAVRGAGQTRGSEQRRGEDALCPEAKRVLAEWDAQRAKERKEKTDSLMRMEAYYERMKNSTW